MDEDWLKERGWTKESLKRKLDALKRQMESDDDSPESKMRRRQYEEMLKRIYLESEGNRREGSGKRKRPEIETIGGRNQPVPPEYREIYEAFNRSTSKRKAPSSK